MCILVLPRAGPFILFLCQPVSILSRRAIMFVRQSPGQQGSVMMRYPQGTNGPSNPHLVGNVQSDGSLDQDSIQQSTKSLRNMRADWVGSATCFQPHCFTLGRWLLLQCRARSRTGRTNRRQPVHSHVTPRHELLPSTYSCVLDKAGQANAGRRGLERKACEPRDTTVLAQEAPLMGADRRYPS